MRAAIAGLERASVDDRCGVILLGPDERIQFASPSARRLLLEYFDSRSDQVLAPDLAKWLESGSAMLVRRLADRWVTVERSGDALLLMETRNELTLTPREREILTWVARGKTNAEVAQILWIAPTTVRRLLRLRLTDPPTPAFRRLTPASSHR